MNKINDVYKKYTSVLKVFGEEKIEKRIAHLLQCYREFLKKEDLEEKVRINERVLVHAVMDYFTDISRIKEFTDIKRVNEYKILAYECYWLLRRKPIQIIDNEDETLIYINEKFILFLIFSFLCNIQVDIKEIPENNLEYMKGFRNSLYYYLKYRSCSAQTFELLFMAYYAGIANSGINFIESKTD